jgi:hypothetical protein
MDASASGPPIRPRTSKRSRVPTPLDDWTKDLGVDATLVNPAGKPAADVRVFVEARTAAMKAELKEYLAGTRHRADV